MVLIKKNTHFPYVHKLRTVLTFWYLFTWMLKLYLVTNDHLLEQQIFYYENYISSCSNWCHSLTVSGYMLLIFGLTSSVNSSHSICPKLKNVQNSASWFFQPQNSHKDGSGFCVVFLVDSGTLSISVLLLYHCQGQHKPIDFSAMMDMW